MTPKRVVFAGTPVFAARHLRALADSPHEVAAVYTQPDRASGRGRKAVASPVKQLAETLGIPVYQPASLRGDAEQQALAALDAELMVVVAYGLILPRSILETPRRGCINVHASLLPRWRGAAPIERALLAGDAETGVTIMQMDEGLDTGLMLYRASTPISPADTRETLEGRIADLGCEALLHTLAHFDELAAQARIQDEALSTYAAKLDKSEALIDWREPAEMISRRIRAGVGRLPACAFLDEQRIRLLEAAVPGGDSDQPPGTIVSAGREGLDIACGEGILRLHELQLPGKNPARVADVLNARRALFEPGRRFSAITASA